MNIANLGGIIGAAGTQLAQAKGTDADRAAQDVAQQDRIRTGQQRAEAAAGLGAAQEDQAISERDADGRMLWDDPAKKPKTKAVESPSPPPAPVDPTGECGSQLDLTG